MDLVYASEAFTVVLSFSEATVLQSSQALVREIRKLVKEHSAVCGDCTVQILHGNDYLLQPKSSAITSCESPSSALETSR